MLEEGLEGSLELSIKMRKKLDENKWDQMTKKAELTEKKQRKGVCSRRSASTPHGKRVMRCNSVLVKPAGGIWQLGAPKLLWYLRKRNSQNLESERHLFSERDLTTLPSEFSAQLFRIH